MKDVSRIRGRFSRSRRAAPRGENFRILDAAFHGAHRGKDDTKRFLNNLGFVEESEVIVVSELGGNVIVQVKGTRVAISRAMAGRILTIFPEEGKR